MNLSETARLLGAMAAFDRRTVGDGDVIAWQAVLSDAAFEDCLEAVKGHYAEQTEWMMPAHVRRAVRDIVRRREMSPWAPGQYGVPRDQAYATVGRVNAADLTGAVREVLTQLHVELPPSEVLHPRQAAWDREHRAFLRSRDAEPNPFYKPKVAEDV